ncbi:hypothetical protein VTL71DRAFT_13281 [Oculimacula yallundae]|uniref:Uncharacterized protein n=1 Tax=Oculimacula yallundae TaxID=86028 RepID=A0ABR4CKE7_9HELO
MLPLQSFVSKLSLLGLVKAQIATLSLGDLQQCNPPGVATPSLTGVTLDVSGGTTPEEGIDIFLSPDLHALVQSTVETSCQEVNPDCLQKVTDLISGPNTELRARQLLLTAYAVFELIQFAVELTVVIIAAVAAHVATPNSVLAHVSVPPVQLTHMSSFATATATVVLVNGVPPFTIIPTPSPTVVTETSTPLATTFTSVADGHNPGDVVSSLPDDIAKRIEEFIRRSTERAAGNALGQSLVKRERTKDFGPVLCADQGIILNVVPGAPFAKIRLAGLEPLPLAVAGAVPAMNAAMDFADRMAPKLHTPHPAARRFAVFAFALSTLVFKFDQPLGVFNTIPAESLKGTITSAPASSTSSSSSGFHCETSTASDEAPKITTTATIPWYATSFIPTLFPVVSKCTDATSFPYDTFLGTYGKFCDEVGKGQSSLDWNVDNSGNKLQALRRRDVNSVQQRSSQLDSDTWNDWRVNLNWAAGEVPGNKCSRSCSEAFAFLATSCGKASRRNSMSIGGDVYVNCGKYSFRIIAPPSDPEPTPKLEPAPAPQPAPVLGSPKLGPLECHTKDQFGSWHADVHSAEQKKWAKKTHAKKTKSSILRPKYLKQLHLRF